MAPLAHLPGVLALCALAGGPIGALATPVLAWGLLRRVPLGRALAATTAGTLLGGVLPARAAGLLGAHEAALFVAVPGALLGFAAAAVWVRARAAGARGGPASAA